MVVMGQGIFLLCCLHMTTLCIRQETGFIQLQPIIRWLAQTKKKMVAGTMSEKKPDQEENNCCRNNL